MQQISEGEGSPLVDNDSAEVTVVQYKLLENGTLSSADVRHKELFCFVQMTKLLFRREIINL